MAKDKDKTPKDIEDEIKGELFKRMVLGQQPKQEDPFEKMRKMMQDPFDAKGFAKRARVNKNKESKPKPEMITFEILGMNPDEIEKARVDGQFAGYADE